MGTKMYTNIVRNIMENKENKLFSWLVKDAFKWIIFKPTSARDIMSKVVCNMHRNSQIIAKVNKS